MIKLVCFIMALAVLLAEVAIMIGAYALVRIISRHVVALLADDDCYEEIVEAHPINAFDLGGMVSLALLGIGWGTSIRAPAHCFQGFLEHVRRATAYVIEPLMHIVCALVVYGMLVAYSSGTSAFSLLMMALHALYGSFVQQASSIYYTLQAVSIGTLSLTNGMGTLAIGSVLAWWCVAHISLCILMSMVCLVDVILLAVLGEYRFSRDISLILYIMFFGAISRMVGPFMIRALVHIVQALNKVIPWISRILHKG